VPVPDPVTTVNLEVKEARVVVTHLVAMEEEVVLPLNHPDTLGEVVAMGEEEVVVNLELLVVDPSNLRDNRIFMHRYQICWLPTLFLERPCLLLHPMEVKGVSSEIVEFGCFLKLPCF